jgi:hypothetical protein
MLRRSKNFRYKIAQFKKDIPKPKRDEVVVIPEDNRIVDTAPYMPSHNLPSWWRDLPKRLGSIRRCQGTYDYITAGFVVPLWTDVTVRPSIDGKFFEIKTAQMGDGEIFKIDSFSNESASGCPFSSIKAIPTAQYPKLISPWRYITPKGVSLMSLPILHEPNPNYTIVPGIVHTDFYHQIHIVLNITTDKEFTIPAGTPMQYMIPISRKNTIKKVTLGNESMYKFVATSGLGLGSRIAPDRSIYYRRKQREIDREVAE